MILQFGSVINPLEKVNPDLAGQRGLTQTGGLISFGSNIIRLLIVAGGVFALFNFIFAGIKYVSSQGDPKTIESAKQQITMSVLGLVIMAASFILAALAGLIIFGDSNAFLNPSIYGPGVPTP